MNLPRPIPLEEGIALRGYPMITNENLIREREADKVLDSLPDSALVNLLLYAGVNPNLFALKQQMKIVLRGGTL